LKSTFSNTVLTVMLSYPCCIFNVRLYLHISLLPSSGLAAEEVNISEISLH